MTCALVAGRAAISPINKWVATLAQSVTHSRAAVLSPLMTINVNRTISAHPVECLTVDGLVVDRSSILIWRLIQTQSGRLLFSPSESHFLLSHSSLSRWEMAQKSCRWIYIINIITKLNRLPFDLLNTREHPGGSLGFTLGVIGSENTPVNFSPAARYTTSLFFSVSAPLWVTRLWTTTRHSPVTHPALWVGGSDGGGGVF